MCALPLIVRKKTMLLKRSSEILLEAVRVLSFNPRKPLDRPHSRTIAGMTPARRKKSTNRQYIGRAGLQYVGVFIRPMEGRENHLHFRSE